MSVIDKIHKTLDPQVWIDADPPSMKPEVKAEIRDRIYDALEADGHISPRLWAHMYLIGSEATYQWTPNGDIDITVVIDMGAYNDAFAGSVTDKEMLSNVSNVWRKINGGLLSGTMHPVNYYFRTDSDIESDGVYNMDSSVWVNMPNQVSGKYEPHTFWKDVWDQAEQIARGWDEQGGNIKRNIIDLDTLKSDMQGLDDDGLDNIRMRILAKEAEIVAGIHNLIGEYDKVHELRRSVFNMSDDMTPEDVYRFSKSWMPANVMYKVLERYGYIQILQEIKRIKYTRGLHSDESLSSIKDMLGWKIKSASDKLNIVTINKLIQNDRAGILDKRLIDEIYYKLINEGNAIFSDEAMASHIGSLKQEWTALYDADTYEARTQAISKLVLAVLDHPMRERILDVMGDTDSYEWKRTFSTNGVK